MSKVEVICIEPCNTYRPGDRFTCSHDEALELEAKGLVKMRAPHSNKMRVQPENKTNPSQGVGAGVSASASPAARASSQQTARASVNGAPKRQTKPAASSR